VARPILAVMDRKPYLCIIDFRYLIVEDYTGEDVRIKQDEFGQLINRGMHGLEAIQYVCYRYSIHIH
jgi:hypothetical protein